ncbi:MULTISPECIES: DNA methyltransferase [Novosphingobium]|uniref:DNA methyltransferase n=1 Tax=Novosphingobium TaxID=165696 RepID=UPI000D6E93CF|nr:MULTISPECIES: DNA methyltransferase [Novosphingobium]
MNDQLKMNSGKMGGTVECLGMTFPNEDARRVHFLGLLAEKLKDPAFRKQEGFPQGTDEAILAMSDPPYYTACPNPWLADFVNHLGKPYDPSASYEREPMAVDVSIGKSDAVYKAHSYHTKVPHLAIVPSILHFTEPGDIVLDGFGGSGMTGIAAQWCGVAPAVFRLELESEWKRAGRAAPKWGARRAVINELSPAATSIAAGLNFPFDAAQFAETADLMLQAVEAEFGWMFETVHTDGQTKCRIDFTVWSEVFICENCSGEIIFFDEAFDPKTKKVDKEVKCPHCSAQSTKENMELVFESFVDAHNGEVEKRPKRVPVLIKYSYGRKSFEKRPDESDLDIIMRAEALGLPSHLPTHTLPDCQMTRVGRMKTTNTKSVHNMYFPREAHVLSALWGRANKEPDSRIRNALKFWLDSHFINMSILNRYRPEVSFPYNPLTGVFYVPSQIAEADPFKAYSNKLKRLISAFSENHAVAGSSIVSTGSATCLDLPENSIDYVFTDPPFGENIYYADLNQIIESWHGVFTDVSSEAIIDRVRDKGLHEYQSLIRKAFSEYFRVLKPGRWMTVVFSNSRAAVWNAIQLALQQAGFVVAEVSALDKKQGSFKQVTSTTAVKQDLVISAYKPDGGLEKRLTEYGAAPESAWDFVQTHLRQLPVSKLKNGILEMVVERDPRRIYDRMVAWFVRHDFPVPLSTEEFLDGLRTRFPERDGMVFLMEQVAEYDRKRAQVAQAPQMELFVSDERSAIDWLMDFLRKRPSTYQEVHPEFTTQVGAGWRKHEERPELSALLADNFLRYDGNGEVPSQIHSYLSTNFKDLRGLEKDDPRLKAKAKDRWFAPDPSKAKDLEQKRERALLKEFESYKSSPGRKLKEFRLEVLRAGFKTAWGAKDYKAIIGIAHKIPEEALQEDEKLLLWYDQALTRMEASA